MTGTKNRNCRDIASREALTVLPMVCSIILAMVIHPTSGKVSACRRSACEPYSMTRGSVLRKMPMRLGEKIQPHTAATSRTEVQNLTQMCIRDRRCAWQTREGIFWKEGAAVMLLDLPASSWVDAGGGLVVLKESFLLQHLPEHLLHARCILPDRGGEALVQCGLPCIRCGDTGELRMSSTQENAVVCVQTPLARLDGSCICLLYTSGNAVVLSDGDGSAQRVAGKPMF